MISNLIQTSKHTVKDTQRMGQFDKIVMMALLGTAALMILRNIFRTNLRRPTYYHQSSNPVQAVRNVVEETQKTVNKPHREALPIDGNSTIASDIVNIWHYRDFKEICVELKQDARCPHPDLLGRLSGPGLAILEWEEKSPAEGDAGTEVCGRYDHNWLDAGDYFVEIIIVHCEDFGVNALLRSNNLTAWLRADHRMDFVEDALRNRITADGGQSIIHVPTSIDGRDSYKRGRWVRKPGLPSRPLFQRFQPVECFQRRRPRPRECDAIINRDKNGTNPGENITGLYEYEFHWGMKISEQELVDKLRLRQGSDNKTTPKICGIGDSHTQFMHQYTIPAHTYWIDPEGIVERIDGHDCDIFFVQVGIWPSSSNTGGQPFPFGKYHDKLKQHIKNILGYNPNATIYLPTIDKGPLMGRINRHVDWRTPVMLDGYSYVNQMLVEEINQERGTDQVKYIDTDFIIYSHYDGHEDWQHLMEKARSPKTIYMLAEMLGESEWLE